MINQISSNINRQAFAFNNTSNNQINFFERNKFNIHQDPIINNYINELYNNYISHNFTKVNKTINKLFNNLDTTFITNKKEYIFIYNSFTKLLRARNFINRYIIKKTIPSKEWVYTNERDLSLTFFGNKQPLYQVKNYNEKTIQIFTISEINNIFRFSIFHSNQNYCFPTPQTPRNPYTNNNLTLKDMILMYNFLLNHYSSIHKCLPEYIIIMKNSYFDIDVLLDRYKNQLSYHSATYFIQNLPKEYKFELLCDLINSRAFIKQHSCITCIKSKNSNLDLFNKVLVLYELNRYGIYDYGEPEILYINICKQNNLFFNKSHYLSHRKIIKAKRTVSRQSNNQNTVEPIIQSELVQRPSPNFFFPTRFSFAGEAGRRLLPWVSLPVNISTIPQSAVINVETQTNSVVENDINESVQDFMNQIIDDVANEIFRNNQQ